MNWICRRKKNGTQANRIHGQYSTLSHQPYKTPNYELDNSGNKHLAYTVIIAVSLETPKQCLIHVITFVYTCTGPSFH